MSANAAVLGLLLAAPGVTAIVGNEIYPSLPDNPTYPAVTFQKVPGGGIARGAVKDYAFRRANILVLSWARSRAQADALAEAVLQALNRPGKVTIAGVAVDDCLYKDDDDLEDSTTGSFWNSMSFTLLYRGPQ